MAKSITDGMEKVDPFAEITDGMEKVDPFAETENTPTSDAGLGDMELVSDPFAEIYNDEKTPVQDNNNKYAEDFLNPLTHEIPATKSMVTNIEPMLASRVGEIDLGVERPELQPFHAPMLDLHAPENEPKLSDIINDPETRRMYFKLPKSVEQKMIPSEKNLKEYQDLQNSFFQDIQNTAFHRASHMFSIPMNTFTGMVNEVNKFRKGQAESLAQAAMNVGEQVTGPFSPTMNIPIPFEEVMAENLKLNGMNPDLVEASKPALMGIGLLMEATMDPLSPKAIDGSLNLIQKGINRARSFSNKSNKAIRSLTGAEKFIQNTTDAPIELSERFINRGGLVENKPSFNDLASNLKGHMDDEINYFKKLEENRDSLKHNVNLARSDIKKSLDLSADGSELSNNILANYKSMSQKSFELGDEQADALMSIQGTIPKQVLANKLDLIAQEMSVGDGIGALGRSEGSAVGRVNKIKEAILRSEEDIPDIHFDSLGRILKQMNGEVSLLKSPKANIFSNKEFQALDNFRYSIRNFLRAVDIPQFEAASADLKEITEVMKGMNDFSDAKKTQASIKHLLNIKGDFTKDYSGKIFGNFAEVVNKHNGIDLMSDLSALDNNQKLIRMGIQKEALVENQLIENFPEYQKLIEIEDVLKNRYIEKTGKYFQYSPENPVQQIDKLKSLFKSAVDGNPEAIRILKEFEAETGLDDLLEQAKDAHYVENVLTKKPKAGGIYDLAAAVGSSVASGIPVFGTPIKAGIGWGIRTVAKQFGREMGEQALLNALKKHGVAMSMKGQKIPMSLSKRMMLTPGFYGRLYENFFDPESSLDEQKKLSITDPAHLSAIKLEIMRDVDLSGKEKKNMIDTINSNNILLLDLDSKILDNYIIGNKK